MERFYIKNDFNMRNEQIGIVFIEYAHEQNKHVHEGVEIVYIVEGKNEHTINNERVKAQKGSLILLNKDCVHSFTNLEATKYYNVMFLPSFLSPSLDKSDTISDIFKAYGSETKKDFIALHFQDEQIEYIQGLFSSMFNESVLKDVGYLNFVQAKLNELIITIVRAAAKENSTNYAIKKGKRYALLDSVMDYITDHCCETLYLEDVATLFGYESTHFSRILKQEVGLSFKQLVIRKRLDKALTEIWCNKGTIEEIIPKYNFTNKTYFYKVFKTHYGTNPKNIMDLSKMITDYGMSKNLDTKHNESSK